MRKVYRELNKKKDKFDSAFNSSQFLAGKLNNKDVAQDQKNLIFDFNRVTSELRFG